MTHLMCSGYIAVLTNKELHTSPRLPRISSKDTSSMEGATIKGCVETSTEQF